MGMDRAEAGAISAFVVFFVIILSYACYRRRRTRNILKTSQQVSLYGETIRQWLAKRRAAIADRKAEEDRTDHGSQVWFSRYVNQGRLRHWVLIIEGTKYELKQDDGSDDFVFRVKEEPNWSAELAKRDAALNEKYSPEVDGERKTYLCLIGWTSLQPMELKRVADKIYGQFGTYHLLWNNCQTILQEFSDYILHDTALDYPWFREHTKTEFQYDQKPPRPPVEMTMAQAQFQQQILRETRGQERMHQIRHDLNLQQTILVSQLQRDTGLGMAQLQMFNNPALFDPGLSIAVNPAMNLASNSAMNQPMMPPTMV